MSETSVIPDFELVDSSVIRAFRYDDERCRLYVVFRESGRTYAYFDVEADVVVGMRKASSIGEYFNRYIRDQYDYEQL
jgi:hypothetical protein